MRHSPILILASLAALELTSACGTAKKSTGTPIVNTPQGDDGTGALPPTTVVPTLAERPTCDSGKEGQIVLIMESKELQICHSNDWVKNSGNTVTVVQTPQTPVVTPTTDPTPVVTPTPSSNPQGNQLAYEVFDANGSKIGTTDFAGYSQSLDNNTVIIQLADKAVMKVNPLTGGFAGDQCFFAASDCSSFCLYPAIAHQKNKIIQGNGNFYKLSGTETIGPRDYNSVTQASDTSTSCMALGMTQNLPMAELPDAYHFPAGLNYPIPAPIEVRPVE